MGERFEDNPFTEDWSDLWDEKPVKEAYDAFPGNDLEKKMDARIREVASKYRRRGRLLIDDSLFSSYSVYAGLEDEFGDDIEKVTDRQILGAIVFDIEDKEDDWDL